MAGSGPVEGPGGVPTGMGLLRHITETSLDEDYAHVARLRGQTPGGDAGPAAPGRATARAAAALVLLVFGVLVAVSAVSTAQQAGSRAASRDYLVARADAGTALLARQRRHITRLRQVIRTSQSGLLATTDQGRTLTTTLTALREATGAVAATGPGITVTVDDAPHATDEAQTVLDSDLQGLANGLWQAGARAVAINGQRLTTLSAIREAGGAITVGYHSLRRPYAIEALGDPDTLATRFLDTAGAQAYLANQSRYGVRFSVDSERSLTVPAASSLALRYAEPARRRGRGARR